MSVLWNMNLHCAVADRRGFTREGMGNPDCKCPRVLPLRQSFPSRPREGRASSMESMQDGYKKSELLSYQKKKDLNSLSAPVAIRDPCSFHLCPP